MIDHSAVSGPSAPPPDALYWKVVNSDSEHAGEMAVSSSVGEGEDGGVSLLLHCNGSGAGNMQSVVFKRSDVANINRETFGAWLAEVEGTTDDDDCPAKPAAQSAGQAGKRLGDLNGSSADTDDDDRGDGSAGSGPNDSEPDAHQKFLTYTTMIENPCLDNADHRKTTLRVRVYVLRATCPRHPVCDRACRLVHYVSRRLCTRPS